MGRDKRDANREADHDYLPSSDSKQPTASQIVAGRESHEELRSAIDALPDAQRIAVRIRHLEGKSLAEIAGHRKGASAAKPGLAW